MSLEGFGRLIMGPGIGTAISIIVILLLAWLAIRWIPDSEDAMSIKKWIRRGRNVLIAFACIGFIIFVVNAASVNLTPRSVIDRDDVNKQQEEFENRHKGIIDEKGNVKEEDKSK